tara:strand:+ start:35818 stop:38598 length:2781 start_codon:yes stop_codon:yes gene_type:complete
MLKYLLTIFIILIILYILSILKEKWYNENFEGAKINVMGSSALEKVMSTIFEKSEKSTNINVNNTLAEEQRLVQNYSPDISNANNDLTFPENCPINLQCSDPPTKDEQAILDVYRNNLRREPDRLGFIYWMERIKKGDSIQSISQSFKDSPEYKQIIEGRDVAKFEEINKLDISKDSYALNQCGMHYLDNTVCCGNPNVNIASKYMCPEDMPICSNYKANFNWGTCGKDGGNGKNNAVILGDYNMHPWKINDTWLDKKAKWIWAHTNADRIGSGSTNFTFYYQYYKRENKDLDIEIHIVCDNYGEVYLNGKHVISQVGGWPNFGVHTNLKLQEGVNDIQVDVVNADTLPNPAGLLMSVVLTDNSGMKEPIISTDNTWSYIPSLPRFSSILMKYNEQIYQKKPDLFNPIVALWNRKHEGFLNMDVDNSIDKYSANGKMSILESPNKKLFNSYKTENAIFKFSRTAQWTKEDTFSLYNCKNSRYVRTNGNTWNIDARNLNQNQNLIEAWESERWTPVFNKDKTVSFKSSKWPDRYLAIHDTNTIISKKLTEIDDDSKWEVLNIDTIYFGPGDYLIENSDNKPGFILKVPKYIGYIGKKPVNAQYYQENIGDTPSIYNTKVQWSDTFMTYNLKNENDDWNVTTIFRTDYPYQNPAWGQKLEMIGINKSYIKHVIPEFELVSTGTSKQLVITKDTLLCYASNNSPYYRYLNMIDVRSDSWKSFHNSGFGTCLIIGEIDNEVTLFAIGIGNNTYIYYRTFKSIISGYWRQYNNVMKDLHRICYDKENKYIIAMKTNGKMYIINSRTTQMELNIPNNFVDFKILDTKVGTSLLLVNKEGHLYLCKLNNVNAETPVLLANNISIRELDSIDNIVFAIDKESGKLYFKPISVNIPFRLYNDKLNGNLIDVHIYKDMIYVINSENKVFRTHIIIN